MPLSRFDAEYREKQAQRCLRLAEESDAIARKINVDLEEQIMQSAAHREEAAFWRLEGPVNE